MRDLLKVLAYTLHLLVKPIQGKNCRSKIVTFFADLITWNDISFNCGYDWNRHYPLAFIIETFLSDSTSRAWFSNLDFSESKFTLIKSIELSCLVTCFWIWVISSAVAKFWLAANHAEIEPLLDRTCSIMLASACSSWRIFSSKSAGTRAVSYTHLTLPTNREV